VEFFSRCQDELISCEAYQQYADGLVAQLQAERRQLDPDTFAERQEAAAREQEIARAYRASEELLREKKCSSFGTLITGAVALLERDALLRATLQNRYATFSSTNFKTLTSRNSAYSSCWSMTPKISSPSGQRSSHLPLSRCVLRQLQAVPRALCQLARRPGFR